MDFEVEGLTGAAHGKKNLSGLRDAWATVTGRKTSLPG
jgi:hypothetical protein